MYAGVDPKRDKPALVDDYCKACWWASQFPTVNVQVLSAGFLFLMSLAASRCSPAQTEDFHPRIVGLTGTPEQVKKAGLRSHCVR